jgi:hypothetical protein
LIPARPSCRGDRVEKAGVGIGRKVDSDIGFRGDRADDLDVEHHLAIGAVWITRRMVLAMIDRNHRDLRPRSDPEPREVAGQIRVALAAAQFDDPDTLALPITGREIVRRCDLHRGQRDRRAAVGVPPHIPW